MSAVFSFFPTRSCAARFTECAVRASIVSTLSNALAHATLPSLPPRPAFPRLLRSRPDAVGVLASQLGPESDPKLLVECAEALRAGGSLEEAMWLFLHAKRYEQALELAVQGRIPMTDDIAEKMTPAKDGATTAADRELVLRQIAECAETSRNFQLACKKYTEAGDKERGVKALIKTGDTKKVLFYAKNSRSPKARGWNTRTHAPDLPCLQSLSPARLSASPPTRRRDEA